MKDYFGDYQKPELKKKKVMSTNDKKIHYIHIWKLSQALKPADSE